MWSNVLGLGLFDPSVRMCQLVLSHIFHLPTVHSPPNRKPKPKNHSDVCTKYQEASKIVNLALQGLVQQCIPGAKVIDLCQFGTTVIDASVAKLYNKKVNGQPVEKGVAFPVCISVNDIVCNHSPLASEELVSFASCVEPCFENSCMKTHRAPGLPTIFFHLKAYSSMD